MHTPLIPAAVVARRPAALRRTLLAAATLVLALPAAQAGDAVIEWNAIAGGPAVVARFGGPYQQFRAMAIVQIAVHDALNAVDPRYETYSVVPAAPAGASADAAVAAAAHDTLLGLLALTPDGAPKTAAITLVDNAYAAALAAIPDGTSETQGVAAGSAAAAAILADRAGDGSSSPHTPGYSAQPGPGVYQPTPNPVNPGTPMFSNWSVVRPFVVDSASQFRVAPGDIFDLTSARYASEYNQVKQQGDALKRGAMPDSEQSDIARFWASGGVDWNANARLILGGFDLDAWQQARALALMTVSVADATLNNAESKYYYAFWRPVTAIRWADDGNPDTDSDPFWRPFLTTPPYPDYPCNSTSAGGGASTALRLALGTNSAGFTRTVNAPAAALPAPMTDLPAKPITRHFGSLTHAAGELARSRVYAGIHFYEGCKAGLNQGAAVAEYIFDRALRPLD
jgi:hypothetical protein